MNQIIHVPIQGMGMMDSGTKHLLQRIRNQNGFG